MFSLQPPRHIPTLPISAAAARTELVCARETLGRDPARIGAIGAPVGELLQRQREHAAGRIGPGEPVRGL